MLNRHLQNRPKPTIETDREFLGLHIKGGMYLELGPYTIQSCFDGNNYVVYCKGVVVYPNGFEDRFENDYDDYDDSDNGYQDQSDDDLDFTACSLDDCGYCGKCMY